MKNAKLLLIGFISMIAIISCKKDKNDDDTNNTDATTGTLIFKGKSQGPAKLISPYLKIEKANGKGADTIRMITVNLKVTLTEIWVARTEVVAGQPDTITWYKIGDGDQLLAVEDYAFNPVTLPVGQYKSIKMNLKNICYRVAAYGADTSQVIEMKESMGSYASPCDYEGLVPTNYFSTDGNHVLDTITNTFVLASAAEKVGGFEIKPAGVTKIYWKLGGETDYNPYDGYFDWYDNNNNGVWDCGVDAMGNFVAPPGVTCMWGFIVEYQ
jgi:hypothetical protein